jgi:hypothetical protein
VRRLLFLAVILLILVIGGGLTAQLATQDGIGGVLPVLQTVENPDGSALALTSQKAELLFLLIGFIVFNLVGIGVTLAVIMWFLHRGVKIAEKIETPQSSAKPVKARAAK